MDSVAYQNPVDERYVATSKSTELAAVLSTPAVAPGHLKLVGHVIVREPVASCVMNQLIVCPSCGFKAEKPSDIETEEGEIVATELIPYRRDQQEKRLASAERSLNLLGKINPLWLSYFISHIKQKNIGLKK